MSDWDKNMVANPKLFPNLYRCMNALPVVTFILGPQGYQSAMPIRMFKDEPTQTIEDRGVINPSIRVNDGRYEPQLKKFCEGDLSSDFRSSVMLDVLLLFQNVLLCIQ